MKTSSELRMKTKYLEAEESLRRRSELAGGRRDGDDEDDGG